MRLFVNSTLFYEIGFVRWGDVSDLRVDRSGASLIGATLNGTFSGWGTVVAAGIIQGAIITPAAVTIWP